MDIEQKKMEIENEKTLKFHNYQPPNEKLRKLIVERNLPSIDSMVNQIIEESRNEFENKPFTVDLNVVPKKASLELKAELQPKLDLLNLQTQQAIKIILKNKYNETNEQETNEQN